MPQYLYRISPARPGFYAAPTVAENEAVDRHFRYLQRAAAEGIVLLAGRTLIENAEGFGIVVLVASSESEAQRFAEEDPAVKAGVFRMELFPFRVALASARGLAAASS